MLVVAIVIIVQAPRCAPQEKLEWVQESAMLQYDVLNGVDADNSGDVNPNGMFSDCLVSVCSCSLPLWIFNFFSCLSQ